MAFPGSPNRAAFMAVIGKSHPQVLSQFQLPSTQFRVLRMTSLSACGVHGNMPTAPQTMYLKMDEAVPCGFAPLYYAQNILKIVVAAR